MMHWGGTRRMAVVGAALLAVALAGTALVLVAPRLGDHRRPAPPPATPSTLQVGPPPTAAPGPGPAAPSASECLARPHTLRVTGVQTDQYKVSSPVSDSTYDLRGLVATGYPDETNYPLAFGEARHGRSTGPPAERLCVVGGKVVGRQPRSLTWQQVKHQHDGDALRIVAGGWYVVDGLRADNVEDGVSPFGDGFVGRNLYLTYIRDDCIENDAISGGYIADSLFDGCSMGLSERPSSGFDPTPPPPGETFTMDRVLLHVQPMPRDETTSDGLGNGQLFKWSKKWSNRLVLRDSIFWVERVSMNGAKAMGLPDGTVAHNVTLVWTGPGDYPASVPPGVTVTKDRTVWDNARRSWLARHDYPQS
jgi:hypothetical protein